MKYSIACRYFSGTSSARVMITGAIESFSQGTISSAGLPRRERIRSHALGAYSPLIKNVGGIDIDKGIEPLVHEGIAPLVRADDHGEPVMTDLMCRYPIQILALIAHAVKDDPGILHASCNARFVDSYGIGINIPLGGKIFDRLFQVFRGAVPGVVTDAFYRCSTDMASDFFPSGRSTRAASQI